MLGGCRRNAANPEAPNAASPAPASKAPVIDPATAGSITGVVHFSGKAPERIKIDMSADPACALSAAEPGGANYTEQYVVADGSAGECVRVREERDSRLVGAAWTRRRW